MSRRVILFDASQREQLYPFVLTRPISDMRIGMLTAAERWRAYHPDDTVEIATVDYLRQHYHTAVMSGDALLVSAQWLNAATDKILDDLPLGHGIIYDNQLLAVHSDGYRDDLPISEVLSLPHVGLPPADEPIRISRPEHIPRVVSSLLQSDYTLMHQVYPSTSTPTGVTLIGDSDQLHISSGVTIPHCIINVTDGPVYIDQGADIMEGSMLRGPLYIGRGARISMGAKIYGHTSIGHQCKIGGEVKRSVFFDHSNKAHDGYVGDSVIGSWCNLGANTNTSNLKNNYGTIRLWNMASGERRDTGEQFVGLMMGDHSRCAIGTLFPTGSVVGVSACILDIKPHTYTPSYSWGLDDRYDLEKAIAVAKTVYSRRGLVLSGAEEDILRYIHAAT